MNTKISNEQIVINRALAQMPRWFDPLGEKDLYEIVFVGYDNHTLYAVSYLTKKVFYFSCVKDLFNSIRKYRDSTHSSGNWWRWHYSSNISGGYENIVILKGTLEAYKKDYPYVPVDYLIEENTTNHFNESMKNYYLVNLLALYMNNPQIELLLKTKLSKIAYDWIYDPENDKFRRAFKKGKTISEITGMENWLWDKMADYTNNIAVWDVLRIWNKQLASEKKKNVYVGFDASMFEQITNLHCDHRTLQDVKRLCTKAIDNDGKKIWSFKTLLNYLERIDMYQAIPTNEAIRILSDYIRMCNQMGVNPRTDSDSIKREHDIAARNYGLWWRQKRAEKDAARAGDFIERGKELSKYEYSNDHLMAIAPKEMQDLINEGVNNHNCVGSYIIPFTEKRSNIFFIRKKDAPEKSYITIELTSTCCNYRQAYYASNQRITDPKDWEFINEWMEHNKKTAEQSFL